MFWKSARSTAGTQVDPLKGMWYLWKVASLCEKLDPVFTCLHPKYIKFCLWNLGYNGDDKNERR